MTPLTRRTLVIATAVVLGSFGSTPVMAQPPNQTRPRVERLDLSTVNPEFLARLAAKRSDRTVSALVQLDGPQALQRRAGDRSLTQARARQAVTTSQDAVVRRLSGIGVQVYGRLTTVLNAVQVRARVSELDRLKAVPGVKSVEVSQLVQRSNAAADAFTGVDRAWEDLGRTGRGQTIGIIDSGIDYTHADFGGPGTPAAFAGNNGGVIEAGTFPTAKVVGGYDLVGDFYGCADCGFGTIPIPDPDPLDCGEGHGTHVAGTAAGLGVTSDGQPYRGPYNRAALRRDFAVAPGAAPESSIRAYRVFGCEGGAYADVIVAAIDRAVADGVDVLNLSLGTTWGTASSMKTTAVNAATQAGILVVAAGSNDGPSAYLSGDPGTADTALSVAAVDAESPELPGVDISGATTAAGVDLTGADLSNGTGGDVVDVGTGCEADAYAEVDGKIAVASRGVCPLTDRATLGQEAGATAVILINNAAGYPTIVGPIKDVTIPFVGVTTAVGARLKAVAGQSITLTAGSPVENPSYRMTAAFSSAGPRRLDSAPKPDLAAPGVSIPSAAIGTGTAAKIESGTSMSSPLVAGIAALVKQAHPTWTPLQLKAALMSTADPTAVSDANQGRVGVGMIQARRAVATRTFAWTSSGLNALAFGMAELSSSYDETRTFKITNQSTRPITYDLAVRPSDAAGARITPEPSAVTVPAGGTRSILIRMRLGEDIIASLPGARASDRGALATIRGAVQAIPRGDRISGTLQMGYLLVPVPVSDIRASSGVRQTAGTYDDIAVTNSGLHSGTADLYSWLLSDPAGDAVGEETPDLTTVGVQAFPGSTAGAPDNDRLLIFAMNLARATSTHTVQEVDLALNLARPNTPDYYLFAADYGLVTTGTPDGTMASFVLSNDGQEPRIVAAYRASAPANSSTILMPMLASDIDVSPSYPRIDITNAAGFDNINDDPNLQDLVSGSAVFDPFQPALSQGNFLTLPAGGAASIPVQVDTAQLSRQTTLGWLVVSPDDAGGRSEADRVALIRSSTSVTRRPG